VAVEFCSGRAQGREEREGREKREREKRAKV
jgi:hypothetical protein